MPNPLFIHVPSPMPPVLPILAIAFVLLTIRLCFLNFDSKFFSSCIAIAQQECTDSPVSPTTKDGDVLENILPQSPPTSDSYPGAFSDFYGFPSHPRAVYRTGDKWPVPKGPKAQRVPIEARPIYNHPIQVVWRTLGERVYKHLDSLGIMWLTINPVRFAEEGGEAGPLYLWVGVNPGSLSLEAAKTAAAGCKAILAATHFPDVEIAFRESVFTRSAGPRLVNHVRSTDPTADIRNPFTGTLSVQIAPKNAPYSEGTGALYLCEGGQSNRIFLLTARHVPLPLSIHRNELYEHKRSSQPPTPTHKVLILGTKAYSDALKDMMAKIGNELDAAESLKKQLATIREGEHTSRCQRIKKNLANAEQAAVAIDAFHSDISKHWSVEGQRVLGHVVYAPPIAVGTGPEKFTEDWALIELSHDKIDLENFKGNVIYLGNKISPLKFAKKMRPRPEDPKFEYPAGGHLQVKDIVNKQEIRKPTNLDIDGEKCLIVIKNGMATGITIGRGTGIESFIREYQNIGIESTSMEFAIYAYSHKDAPFSACGDSGSIIVDGLGRIVGLLTGGAGATDSTDVTYVTPYFWLEEQIKKVFPNSYLYPIKE
ncbi:hypothetical protein F5887DRAFT_1083532 [Amanita rubescens]|nr:hypothetical protein F5887DRAFT_1083532 [Amanita rubescens]